MRICTRLSVMEVGTVRVALFSTPEADERKEGLGTRLNLC